MLRDTSRLLVIILLLIAMCAPGMAVVTPNGLFCDNAVLQRGIAAPVWGTADDGERVTVSFQDQRVTDVAKGGKWMVRLEPLTAGGPITMTIEGSNKIELKNILVGEVWICSGQSNMAMTLKGVANAADVIPKSGDSMMRLFTVARSGVENPADDLKGQWVEAAPGTTESFSAVGYFFGRDLRKSLNVPVGLINTSYGGTRIESWTSAKYLGAEFERLTTQLSAKPDRLMAKDPARLFNGMIHPLIPYGIRGAIWYQGEANSHYDPYGYRDLMANMIRNWREDWGQGQFPFLLVQLAPFSPSASTSWAVLRESQLVTSLKVPNTAMAVITDVGDAKNIHPKRKEPVGARLALAARAIAYGEKLNYRGPVYKSVSFDGNRAIVEFDTSGLVAKDGDLKGFAVAGEDKVFHDAKATIDGNRVTVSSPDVAKPVAVRFGWSNCPDVNLFDSQGLPASPFRTDDFAVGAKAE